MVPIVVVVVALSLLAACSRRNGDTGAPSLPPGTAQSGPGTTPGSTAGGTAGPMPGLVADGGGLVPYGSPIQAPVAPVTKVVDASLKTPDGRDRTFHVYVPSTLPKDTRAPLVIALHGGGGNGTQFETQSGFDAIAEANQFIVVYPDGIPVPIIPNGRVWNGGGCCGPAAADRENVDDVTFISLLIDEMEKQYPIDTTRVFATGHSNGAIMSFRLACALSDKIVAIAVQAGTLFVDSCQPSRPVSILEIHGSADMNLPYDGGQGDRSITPADFPPPIDGLNTLGKANGCPATPAGSTDARNPDLSFEVWAPCEGSTLMERVRVEGANHAWMGHPPANKATAALVGDPYLGFDSSAAVWSFLAAHPRR
jgi:polyhydroxybutyrate depolymerase